MIVCSSAWRFQRVLKQTPAVNKEISCGKWSSLGSYVKTELVIAANKDLQLPSFSSGAVPLKYQLVSMYEVFLLI